MTSTIVNRAPAGSRVWCYECNTGGTITRTDVLGIDYGVEVLADTGDRYLLCGTRLRWKCEQILAFVTALEGLGESQENIDLFRQKWLENTEREYQRIQLYNGLLQAQENETVVEYINQVKVIIGMV